MWPLISNIYAHQIYIFTIRVSICRERIEPYWDPKRDKLVYDIDGWVVAVELPRGEDIYVVGMTGNLFLPVQREQVKSRGGGGGGVWDGFSGLTVSV